MSHAAGWSVDAMPDLHGRRILVTGGNTGIGLATAQALAARGASVIIACRDARKAEAARVAILASCPRADIAIAALDLAALASVRDCASRLLDSGQPLDVLINNAGVMTPPFGRTADGFELQFGVNVLGHFALTALLLPLLQRAPAARVVTLSSRAHEIARLDFANLGAEKGYRPTLAYGQSKLGNLLFAFELQRRLARAGDTTISIAAHPGVTISELARDNATIRLFMKLVSQSAAEGARSSLMAATDPALRGGEYIGPGGWFALKGPPRVQRPSRAARDPQLATRLWDTMQDMTGVRCLDGE